MLVRRSSRSIDLSLGAILGCSQSRTADRESKAINKLLDRLTGKDSEKKTADLYKEACEALQQAYSSATIKV
jgi:hypothetical protein